MEETRDMVIRLGQTIVDQRSELNDLKKRLDSQSKTVTELRLSGAALNGYRRGSKGVVYLIVALLGGGGFKAGEWLWKGGG